MKNIISKAVEVIQYLRTLRYAVIAGMCIALVLPKLFTAVIVLLLLLSGTAATKESK